MARTIEAITAELQAAHPTLTKRVNGQDVVLDAAAYGTRILQMATAVQQAELDAEAAAALKEARRQVRLALSTLDADIALLQGTPTNAQVRDAVLHDSRILRGIIRFLIDDMRVIEPTDPQTALAAPVLETNTAQTGPLTALRRMFGARN